MFADTLNAELASAADAGSMFERIEATLINNDVVTASYFVPPVPKLHISAAEQSLRATRERYRRWIGNRRYGREICTILNQNNNERVIA